MKKYVPIAVFSAVFFGALLLAMQNSFEMDILLWLQNHRTQWLTIVMRIFTSAGDFGAVWILAGAALTVSKRYRRQGFVMLLTLGVCFLLSEGFLKNIICRPRPFRVQPELDIIIPPPVGMFSFPSGHSSAAFAGALSLSYTDRRFSVMAFSVAVLVAVSRIYFGVHYPTDIIAGAAVGLCCAYVIWKVFPIKNE